MKINLEAFNSLIENCKGDTDLLEAIEEAFLSFEEYHRAIYIMETRKKLLNGTVDSGKYQEEVTGMDKRRTNCHNAVLANMSMLNRMAAMQQLPPIYDGQISQDQPYRRQVADAVLEFVQGIILNRP